MKYTMMFVALTRIFHQGTPKIRQRPSGAKLGGL